MAELKRGDYVASLKCPECTYHSGMVVRENSNTGHLFLGCQRWPECSYTQEIPEAMKMEAAGQARLFDD